MTRMLKMAEPTMAETPSSNSPWMSVAMTVLESSGKLEPTAAMTAPCTTGGSR